MQITFYKTSSMDCDANKTLSSALTLTGNVQKDFNILHPEVEVPYSESLLTYNYCYIPLTKRYYYIGVPTISNNSIKLPLDVDALMSHREGIKNCYAHIIRGSKGNKYLVDNLVIPTAKHDIDIRQLGTGFTHMDNYILTVGGAN